jgi:methylglutaconyl-CoA hydratase
VTGIPGFAVESVVVPGERVRVEALPRGVMRLVLARPEVRNAFDAAMIRELGGALEALAARPAAEVRLLLLQGEGEVFSAGADLAYMKEQAGAGAARNLEDAHALAGMYRRLASFPTPVLCVVQGAAVGGGLGLAACADFVLAAPDAVFATSEVLLGLVPGVIGPYVVRRLGLAHAAPLMLSGRRLAAPEALLIGLVHSVAEDSASLGRATARWLERFLAAGPGAARRTKELLLRISPLPDPSLLEVSARAIAEARASTEGQEGLRAFFDKAPPDWAR